MADFDVVVCGLGAMGSAALYQLARRRVRVLGLERFAPGHDRGSSHGATRIFRLGYFEHPSYVPLLRRAQALWRELEAASGRPLLHVTGIAEIGAPDGVLVPGTLASTRQHGLRHEVLTAPELARRFPAFRVPPDYVAVVQPDGGFVEVEPSLAAQIALATAAGAELRAGERVTAIEPGAGGVRIVTERGTVAAKAAIVAAGPWTGSLLPGLSAPLRVTREVTAWFEPADATPFAPGRFPVFIIENRHGMHYGVPPHGGAGVKAAKHHHRDQAVDPDGYDRTVSADDERLIRAALADHIPAANGRLLAAKTCLYTMTPDGDFLIDRLPGHPNVIVASPCSGHGFKFAPVIGEILADLATGGTTRHDIARFALAASIDERRLPSADTGHRHPQNLRVIDAALRRQGLPIKFRRS
jgi:sarcosine oxidase